MTILQNLTKHSLVYLHCVTYSLFLTLLCKHMNRFQRLKFSLLSGLALSWLPILTQHLYGCPSLLDKSYHSPVSHPTAPPSSPEPISLVFPKKSSMNDDEHYDPQ